MRWTNGQYSIPQPGAFLKQLLIVYFKKMQTIEESNVLFLKSIIHRKHDCMLFPRVDGFVDQTN